MKCVRVLIVIAVVLCVAGVSYAGERQEELQGKLDKINARISQLDQQKVQLIQEGYKILGAMEELLRIEKIQAENESLENMAKITK